MSISLKQIEHLAELARLELTADEKKQYQKELSGILGYVEKIQSLKSEAVVTPAAPGASFREDKIVDCPADEVRLIVDAFPEKEGNLNKVKAVFD